MNIQFKWVGGATWILRLDGLKIACDPLLCPKGTVQEYQWFSSERLSDPVYSGDDFDGVDLWLLTHNHLDHLDSGGIEIIPRDSNIVCEKNILKRMKARDYKNIMPLRWLESKFLELGGWKIKIKAIPAFHGKLALTALLAGKGNGYYVEMSKGEFQYSFYVSGDTFGKRPVYNALKGKRCDLFIPNIGEARLGKGFKANLLGSLTMNFRDMDGMREKINPALTIPVHYGTFSHYAEKAIAPEAGDGIKVLDVGETLFLNRGKI